MLSPEETEGPFYVEYDHLRSDITEKQRGVVLSLAITVIDFKTCKPIPRAAVTIWQANAAGIYSHESSEHTSRLTYLRGAQITNAKGQAIFKTIYPGWYPGRCQHIHVKVIESENYDTRRFSGGTVIHVGQIYFPQKLNNAVARVAPYSSNKNTYTTNAQDQIYVTEHGNESILSTTGSPAKGYAGKIRFAVNRGANYGKG